MKVAIALSRFAEPGSEPAAALGRLAHIEGYFDRAAAALLRRDYADFDHHMRKFRECMSAHKDAGLSTAARIRKLLRARDGKDCWLCGKPMTSKGPTNATIEHLVPQSAGGGGSLSDLSNLVLAHHACNVRLGVMPLADKLKLKEAVRAAMDAAVEGDLK